MKKRALGKELAEIRTSAKKWVPCPEVPFTVVSTPAPLLSESVVVERGFEWRCRHDGVPRRRNEERRGPTLSLRCTSRWYRTKMRARSSDLTPGRCRGADWLEERRRGFDEPSASCEPGPSAPTFTGQVKAG